MDKNFCSLPWTGLDIGPQGGFRPCCKYKQDIAQDLDSYLDSDELKILRKQFLSGQRPNGCQRCWDDEDAGLISKRQIDHQYSFDGITPDLGSLKILSMGFGNTCNLACITCGSHSSSRWAAEEKRMDVLPWQRMIFDRGQHYQNSDLLSRVADMSDDLVHLEIPGGEPFYADAQTHIRFLSSLKHPERIKLHYVTNVTVFPDIEFWEIWKRFRAVDIQLSIDGIGARFEYLRWPADWTKVQENIARYQEQNVQISISHTVSWLNILYTDEFISWCKDQSLPTPYLGPVSRPEYLSPVCLPKPAKQQIRQRLEHTPHASVQKVLDYMDRSHSNHFDMGLRWTKVLDQRRQLDFKRTFPELSEIIQNC